jgi:site-specific recombinase XerD
MQLWAFLDERGLGRVGDFSEHAVNLFRAHLRQRGVSENTISNRLRAIKACARLMGEKGWTDGHVLSGLHVPQSSRPHFDLIPDDVRATLITLYSPDTYRGSRNLALLAVLSDTGLRREELANLVLKNVDLEAHVLKVYADKTDEWRYVPLTDEVVALLHNRLKWRERHFSQPARHRLHSGEDRRRRKPRAIQSDYSLLAWNGTALTPDGVSLIFTRAR